MGTTVVDVLLLVVLMPFPSAAPMFPYPEPGLFDTIPPVDQTIPFYTRHLPF